MRDYADQIDSLRLCAENDDPVDECCWEDCNQHRGNRDNMCRQKIMMDAADAIEELLARDVVPTDFHERCLQLEIRKRIELEKQMPHWISVEERLPKKDGMVIVYYSWTGQSGTEYKEVSLATLDEMRYCGNKLLGWMPLPEPPKEVQDG